MSLLTLWKQNRDQLDGKRLHQLISFAGDGKLTDGNGTSEELRELLAAAPSELLNRWKDEALEVRYEGFGFVLQDLVNEVGRRLGFYVVAGRYRGRQGEDGHDGLWTARDGRVLLIETKTSSSHRIELRRLTEARQRYVQEKALTDNSVSTLIIIAEEDTTELEAQVRGSRSAWEVRLLGVDALYKLLSIKQALDNEAVERQIQGILVPEEFTRLDRIIDLVFATAEDVQDDEQDLDADIEESPGVRVRRSAASAFHSQILPELEKHFGKPLVKRSRVIWGAPDDSLLVSCQVSRSYEKSQGTQFFWFGLKRSTEAQLSRHPHVECAFGLGTPSEVVVLPYQFLRKHLDGFSKTYLEDGQLGHWHVRFRRIGQKLELLTEGESIGVDIRQYVLSTSGNRESRKRYVPLIPAI